MDFTRQPIIETVITPKEGCKLVVRSSKSVGQEEYFVDSVEVVSFGSALFFRNQEKPKAFLVPVSDYEVLQVRETRMVLKTASKSEKGAIKIGGGKPARSEPKEESETAEKKTDKKRRRSGRRRRRGEARTDETETTEEGIPQEPQSASAADAPELTPATPQEEAACEKLGDDAGEAIVSRLLPPPAKLISDSIERYRENELFKDAFFSSEEEQQGEDNTEEQQVEEAPHDSSWDEPSQPPQEGESAVEEPGEQLSEEFANGKE